MNASEPAPAKVNLFLHVTGRRPDGYHELDSLAVFPAIGDRLSWVEADEFSLEVTGPFATGLTGEADNLVLRAGRALAKAAGVRARGHLTLEKNLPVASGIGGGSADAAAALRLLARVWSVTLPPHALEALALGLGADVPACLASRAVRMSGIGDVLASAPALPACGIALVNPGIAVPTPAVFRARAGPFSPAARLPDRWTDAQDLADALAGLSNDLQCPAIAICPEIAEVLATLSARPECLLARMSGSGATCYALCATPAAAGIMAAAVRRPGWWSWGGDCQAPLAV